ncbi:MAG: hypothetical protein K2Y21_02445 [Phycisphaerales bacterium]|nr:hypothetical protein [Phycisphaerales bacterium]
MPMKVVVTLCVSALACYGTVASAATTLNFESLAGTSYVNGSPVPSASRLSDQLVSIHGVRFTSSGGFASVVDLGVGHAVSGSVGLAGSSADGNVSYGSSDPIEISFWNPANTSQRFQTDSVSLRGDLWGSGQTISLKAFDRFGNFLAEVSAVDSGGTLLSISAVGIHSVIFSGVADPVSGGVGIDDLSFGALTIPAPSMLVPIIGSLIWTSRRRRSIR